MTLPEWWPWAVISFVAFPLITIALGAALGRRRTDVRFQNDFGLDADSRWNGREVSFTTGAGLTSVRIAAVAPYRLRVAHESSDLLSIGFPALIDYPMAPPNVLIWCDHPALPQQIFADQELAERLKITIRAAGDVVELRPKAVHVDVSSWRFESAYAATHAAWRAATMLVERLHLGIPEGGELPLIEISSHRPRH